MACIRYAVNMKNPEVEICNKSSGFFFVFGPFFSLQKSSSTFPGKQLFQRLWKIVHRDIWNLNIFFFCRRMPNMHFIKSIPAGNYFIFGFWCKFLHWASVSFNCYKWKYYGNFSTIKVSDKRFHYNSIFWAEPTQA